MSKFSWIPWGKSSTSFTVSNIIYEHCCINPEMMFKENIKILISLISCSWNDENEGVSIFCSITSFPLYRNYPQNNHEIHKGEWRFPSSHQRQSVRGPSVFCFSLNTQSSLDCVCLSGHRWNTRREYTHGLESSQTGMLHSSSKL